MRNYFIFDGRDTRTEGITLLTPPVLQRAKERVTQVTIPGRAGVLTVTEGQESFEPYIQGITINVRENELHRVLSWLKGEGYVTFSTDPDKRQKARIINLMQFKKISRHIPWVQGTVQFYCHPLKEELHPQLVTVDSGDSLANLGDVPEKPVITVRGTGAFSVTVGDNTLSVTGITSDMGGAVIDCDAQEVTDIRGTQLITHQTSGTFPSCEGIWTLTYEGDGVQSVTVKRAQRWL